MHVLTSRPSAELPQHTLEGTAPGWIKRDPVQYIGFAVAAPFSRGIE